MDLSSIESELKKRWLYPYIWGGKQNNELDKLTNFIYHTFYLEDVISHLKKLDNQQEVFIYALNRWYNFWSAKAIEYIFSQHSKVTPHPNSKHKKIDFYLQDIAFDHKTSIFPKAFPHSIEQAQKEPQLLLKWLYEKQSQQQRKHFANRLFIVLHHPTGQHWQLKAEVSWLAKLIEQYLDHFNPQQLIRLSENTLSDIIWAKFSMSEC